MLVTRRPPVRGVIAAAWVACSLLSAGALHAAPAQQDTQLPARQDAQLPARLSLDIAIEILLDRNPTILAERESVAAARAAVLAARPLPNPTIAYEAEKVGGATGPDATFWNDQDLNLIFEQRIPIGGRRAWLVDVADAGVLASQSTLQDTIRRLTLELESRHYDVVLAEQELALASEILGQFDQVVELMEQRYQQGEASGLELARLRTERLRFFNDQVSARAGAGNAKVALLELLGVRSMATDFEVAEQLTFGTVPVDPAALETEALANRPDLAAQRDRLEQARRRQGYERALRVPDLVPYVGYNRDFGQDNLTFGVAVDIPFFDRNQGGIARAVAEGAREEHLLRAGELRVRRDVRQAYNVVVAQRALVEAMQADYVPNAEQAHTIAQASYTLGALDLIAFLDAERAYRETLRAYYQALYDHQIARFVLEAVVGGGGVR
jgi:cobalt-zinc-cadmium efflux system outer membrane protein